MRAALLAGLLATLLLTPAIAAAADAPGAGPRLDWDTGEGRSYWIPALEIGGFSAALNQFDRHFVSPERDYDTDVDSIGRNLRTAPVYDRDPFSVNQIGHPYQGSIYYGFARSAGLPYWQSLLGSLGGSFLWETAGETTRPSINDYVSTGVGGSFIGEAAFRMASLLLEGGGEQPGFWRELGAALISPPTGFNRLVFGERFKPVFPSRDPEVFLRLRVGATVLGNVDNEGVHQGLTRRQAALEYAITYGLPGKPGYRYRRPFDYFHFQFTVVPNADSVGNAVENATIRGLLAGAAYAPDEDVRGVWGLFAGYDYFSPQIFRVATTNVFLGTVAQWWLAPGVALQTTALGGVGFGAAGTVAARDERDYHFGVVPQALLGLRLIFGERAMLEATGRQYFVIGTGSGPGPSTQDLDAERIARAGLGLSVRLWGPHAIAVQYLYSARDARPSGLRNRHQSVEAVTLSYEFLGHDRFGAVEWPRQAGGR